MVPPAAGWTPDRISPHPRCDAWEDGKKLQLWMYTMHKVGAASDFKSGACDRLDRLIWNCNPETAEGGQATDALA